MIGSMYSVRVSADLNALHTAQGDTFAMVSANQYDVGSVAIAIRKVEMLESHQ